MQYQYCPNDPQRYSTGLHQDKYTKNLIWDSANGQDVILVQTPYEKKADEYMPQICKEMESKPPGREQFKEVLPNVWVRYMTAIDRVQGKGCPLHGKACTYTVLSCVEEGNVTRIFAPRDQSMYSPYCNIPMDVHIQVERVTQTVGLFRKREENTAFWRLVFPQEFGAGYVDGSLIYRIETTGRSKVFEMPVTRGMVQQGEIYIRSEDIRPIVVAKNKGLRLT